MDALLDRRKFIVGAVAGGFAAATLGSCSPKTEEGAESAQADQASDGLNAESARQSRWAFETPPEPVDEGSVTDTYEADIVVVGAGVSGLVCAASAAEEGADVILFAASAAPVSRGGSNHGINTKAQERLGIDYTPENVKYLMKKELAYNSVRPRRLEMVEVDQQQQDLHGLADRSDGGRRIHHHHRSGLPGR